MSGDTRDSTAQSRQCGRKVIYPDLEHARAAAKLMHKRKKARFEGYQCHWCHGFHVGGVRKVETAMRRTARKAAE